MWEKVDVPWSEARSTAGPCGARRLLAVPVDEDGVPPDVTD